jgi:hypothetical protein
MANKIPQYRQESDAALSTATTETRKRRRWAYIREDELRAWAAKNNVDGGDEQLVRAFFKDAMIATALRRESVNQHRIVAVDAVPATYNPEAAVESGVDPNGIKFFAIWDGGLKGPEFPPTFQ